MASDDENGYDAGPGDRRKGMEVAVREDRLRRAEKLLRQGRLEPAIDEYVQLVDEDPNNWGAINNLGDLLLRAGQRDKAVERFTCIADHFFDAGFMAKAGAVYRKILKVVPGLEPALLRLADISLGEGLLGEAASCLATVAEQRMQSGDRRGAADLQLRIAALDPRDALPALQRALDCDPSNDALRLEVARGLIEAGAPERARTVTAGAETPDLLLCLAEAELLTGNESGARNAVTRLLRQAPDRREQVLDLGVRLAERAGDAAFQCIDAATNTAMANDDFALAVSSLQDFVTRVPGHVPALLRLVEVCFDGGSDAQVREAQALLADAYLAAGQPREARFIAEDLAAREPRQPAAVERFRRALVMLGEPDPDKIIAERLSDDSPLAKLDLGAGTEEAPAGAESPVVAATAPAAVSQAQAAKRPKAKERDEQPESPQRPAESPRRSAPRAPEADRSDEAVAALRQAVRSPKHRFESAAKLARLHRDRGETHDAIEWFERATQAAPGPDATHEVLYELGQLLVSIGESDRALAVFMELEVEAPGFRDVPGHIAHLSQRG